MNLRLAATLETNVDPAAIAGWFAAAGWDVRKCGWFEYEARSEWAELVIESSNPVLLHGVASAGAFENVVSVLRAKAVSHRVECYRDGLCIADERWPLP